MVNNENEFVLFNQIACALCEMPMTPEEVQFYFVRTQTGFEIDLLIESGGKLRPVEIKAAATCRDALAANVRRFAKEESAASVPTLVYDGEDYQMRQGVRWVNFRRFMA